jgi:excisionase family DNA binding protein
MSSSGTETPALVTKVEAARLLGVSRYTIMRLVERGSLREVFLDSRSAPRLRREDVLGLARGEPDE